MQKESSFKKIISYAGKDKGKIYVSALLSAISALAALVPYYYLWQIIHGIIFSDPATDLKGYGWIAFLWVVIAAALSIFSLFLSHQASVLVSANIRKKLIAHVAELPYEEFQSLGTGRLRKTITESAETIERYVAYQFPEQICTLVTPVGVLVMIFAFDLRLGLFSIISLVLGIILLVCFMGKGLVKVMKDYQDALEQMSGDVGEYVRDIPVVKIFGQSILSFRKLKGSIDHYEAMVTAYIKRMELPMVAYSVAIYSTFVFLTIGGVMISDGGVNASNLSNYIFYVVFTPAIVLMMNRFMYQSKSGIYVKDAFTRIDSLLSIKPEADILASHTASSPSLVSDCPETFDISLEDVSFCYGQDHNKAVDHISLQVREGSCAVFVGSSGSGKTLVTPVGVLVMIFAFDLRLGLFSIISLVLGIILLVCFMGKGLVKVMKDYQDALEQMSGDVGEYVRDIPVVKIFGQSILSFRKLKGSIDHYEAMVTAYIKRMELPMVAYSVAIYSTFVFLTIGGVMISDGGVNASNLSNYIFYVVFTPAIVLMMNRFMYQSKSGIYVKDAFTRIDSLLSIKPEADILASHTASSPSLVSDCPETFDISLEDVSFCYGQDHNKAVDHISLQVREGSCAVFVGSSGSGKTTLANLIAGLYPVQEGEIRIGGVDVNRISREQLTRLVACVYQDSHLIKGSILDNIRLSHPGASQEEVLEALKNAQCMDIIEKFPEGIHTRIGTKGVHLSGGEVQRLAIARALLKNAPIVILDEATAYADPDNEQKIREALHTLTEGKTVILIAHRLSTLGRGEEIYVFSEGKILEQGTGEVLMQQKGLYYEMCRQYQQSSSWHIKNSKAKERDLQQKAHPEGAVS